MLSRSQVEEPRSSREAGPAVATVMPLAAPPLASFEKEERSPSASADAPRDLRSTVGGMRETLVTPEAEVKASQIAPDISVASQDRKPMATASSVPSASRVQPSAAEAGAGAARRPEDAEAIVIAPSLRGASEPPVLPEKQSASSRRIESMPRESRKADPADAVVPTELATANASMLPASGPRTTEGPAVADLGSRLSADRVQFAKEREPARSAEPIGVAALPTDRPEMVLAERLVGRAERLIDLRDVGGARLLLERAVSLGHGRSAHLLAQTYDPSMLRAWGIVGMNGDLSKAKELYDRARTGPLTGTPSR